MEALRSVFPQHNSPSKKKRSFFKRKITSSIAVLKFWRAEKVCAGVWTSWFLNCEEKRKREMLLRKNQFRFWLGGPKFVRYTLKIIKHSPDGLVFGTGLARYENKVFRGGVHDSTLRPFNVHSKPLRIGSKLTKNYVVWNRRYLYGQWTDFDDERTKRKSFSCSTQVYEKSQHHTGVS